MGPRVALVGPRGAGLTLGNTGREKQEFWARWGKSSVRKGLGSQADNVSFQKERFPRGKGLSGDSR